MPILNLLVQYSPVDRTLAEPFGISLTGMKKHVRCSRAPQLVATHVERVFDARLAVPIA